MMVMNGQCSYSKISCTGTLVKGKMQIGKLLAKLITKAPLETCGLHHRSPSWILILLLVHFCLNPNPHRIAQEERKWFAFILVDNTGAMSVKRSPLWQLGKKRSRDTLLVVSSKFTNRKIVQWRGRVSNVKKCQMYVYSGHALIYTKLIHRHATQTEGNKSFKWT